MTFLVRNNKDRRFCFWVKLFFFRNLSLQFWKDIWDKFLSSHMTHELKMMQKWKSIRLVRIKNILKASSWNTTLDLMSINIGWWSFNEEQEITDKKLFFLSTKVSLTNSSKKQYFFQSGRDNLIYNCFLN